MKGRFIIPVIVSILILGISIPEDAFAQIPIITETQKVFPDGEFIDDFGFSVSIDGNTAVVGTIFDFIQDPPGTFFDTGAAYIYERNSEGEWIQVQVIRPSGNPDDAQFGNSVAISGDTIVVGAHFEGNFQPGAAYIFEKTGGVWPATETKRILASDIVDGDNFGTSVDISGDTVIVGSFTGNGGAYVFEKNTGVWPATETKKILPSDGAFDFGASVSIDGNTVVVGASFDVGSAYIFEKGGSWPSTETKIIIASDRAENDNFGVSVSISGDTVIVGANFEDVNGSASGSAYIFEKTGGVWPATETKKIFASDGTNSDNFGTSVSISGDIAIAGSPTADGFSGFQDGVVYVFVKKQGVWPMTESQKLQGSTETEGDEFGSSVSISSGNVIVGLPEDDILITDNSGSAYFFKVAITETQKIIALNDVEDDEFGFSVSISGDTAIVGAPLHGQTEDGAGAAYIFERNFEGVWTQVQELRAADDPLDDHFFDLFGSSVAIDGNTAVVGSEVDTRFGTVYIFDKTGGVWPATETKLITSGDPDLFARDGFGFSVAISGDTIAIGYAERDSDPTTVRDAAGAVYILERNNGGTNNWGRVAILTSDAPVRNDFLGHSISISGDTVIAGAPFVGPGAAYIFEKTGSVWPATQTKKITASDGLAADDFGLSVSISGDTVIVGAPDSDENGSKSGSAYIFEKTGSVWPATQTKKITASDALADDNFGFSVSISGDTAIVGAPFDDGNTPLSGTVYIFEKTGGVWPATQTNKGLASDGEDFDEFGFSVSMSGDKAIVGAWFDDDACLPTVSTSCNSGSAYIFEFESTVQADLSLVKTFEPDIQSSNVITRGDTFTYFLTVKNNGPNEAVNVVVTDNLPSIPPTDVAFMSTTVIPGPTDCTHSSGTVTCNLGNMALNEEKIIAIIVKTNDEAPRGEIILNEATVKSDTEDPNPLNDNGMVSFPIEITIWDGGGDGINWSDPLNWNTDEVPEGNSQIIIQDAIGTVHLNTDHEIIDDGFLTIIDSNTLEIDSAKKLTNNSVETITISAGATLINKGVLENFALINNEGTIENDADFINQGTLNNDGFFQNNNSLQNIAGTINNTCLINNAFLIEPSPAASFINQNIIINSGMIAVQKGSNFVDLQTVMENSVVMINGPEIPVEKNKISGRVVINTPDRGLLPLNGMKMKMIQASGTNDFFTDKTNGNFLIEPIPDEDVSLQVFLEDGPSAEFPNGQLVVKDISRDNPVAQFTTTPFDSCIQIVFVELSPNANFELSGKTSVPSSTNVGTFGNFAHLAGVYHYMMLGFDFVKMNLSSLNLDDNLPLEVIGFSNNVNPATGPSHFTSNPEPTINLRGPEKNGRSGSTFADDQKTEYKIDTLYHELTHYLVYESSLGGENDRVNTNRNVHANVVPYITRLNCHQGYTQLDSSCAWNEGFATWLSAVISDKMLTDDSHIPFAASIHHSLGGGKDLEMQYNSTVGPRFEDVQITHLLRGGSYEEYGIASLLWDLVDDTPGEMSDGIAIDPHNIPINFFWTTITTPGLNPTNPEIITTFSDLYTLLKNSALLTTAKLDELFGRFDICVDGPDANTICNAGEIHGRSAWFVNLGTDSNTNEIINFDYPSLSPRSEIELYLPALVNFDVKDEFGNPIDEVKVIIETTLPDGQKYGYETIIFSGQEFIDFSMPNPSETQLIFMKDGFSSQTITIDSQDYYDGFGFVDELDQTNDLSFSLVLEPDAIPDAITDLALSVISDTQVDLSWTTPADGGFEIIGYKILRNLNGAGITLLQAVADPTLTAFSDNTLSPGDLVKYSVLAVNANGNAPFSNIPVPVRLGTAPDAITDLSLTVVSGTQVDLSWTTPNNDGSPILGYHIFRNLGAGFVPLETVSDETATSFSDTTLTSGTTVTYMIRAVNADGPAAQSNIPATVSTP